MTAARSQVTSFSLLARFDVGGWMLNDLTQHQTSNFEQNKNCNLKIDILYPHHCPNV
jgi:hypothetical protein